MFASHIDKYIQYLSRKCFLYIILYYIRDNVVSLKENIVVFSKVFLFWRKEQC